MPIDVSQLATLFHQFVIVTAGQQPHVVNLWDARGEKLDGPGGDIGVVVLHQRVIKGAGELIDGTHAVNVGR